MYKRMSLVAPVFVVALALLGGGVSPADAAFGPTLKKCGKLKKAAKRSCLKQNSDVRKAFAQVANSRFTGTHFGGTTIDATFCKNGKWSIQAVVPGLDPQLFKGKRWQLKDVYVKGKLISLNAVGPSRNIHTDVALQKRGTTWYLSDGNPTLKAPKATKTSAKSACRSL